MGEKTYLMYKGIVYPNMPGWRERFGMREVKMTPEQATAHNRGVPAPAQLVEETLPVPTQGAREYPHPSELENMERDEVREFLETRFNTDLDNRWGKDRLLGWYKDRIDE